MCRDKHDFIPLRLAAAGGKLDTVQYLISEQGCDPMCRGAAPLINAYQNSTPLHLAALFGILEVVKYLIA